MAEFVIERPLDFLNKYLNQNVFVRTKNGDFTGKLLAWDIHINLVLRDVEDKKKKFNNVFLRGESIIFVAPIKIKGEKG